MSNVEESMGNLALLYTARGMYSEIQLLGGWFKGICNCQDIFLRELSEMDMKRTSLFCNGKNWETKYPTGVERFSNQWWIHMLDHMYSLKIIS